jgi:hypothetical protein
MSQDLDVSEFSIKDKIYSIREKQVMLDHDLAELYSVETKQLNRTVKRNRERFPAHFMFQLSENELNSLRCHFGTIKKKRGEHRKYLPHVFTEQGVAMLSGVLRSKTAVQVSIKIVDSFIAMRKFIHSNAQVLQRLSSLERKQLQFDSNFEKLFEAIGDRDFVQNQGIFFDGQVFDTYKFVSDLIRSSKKSIILVDNYIDDTVLTLFSKRRKNVEVIIYTKNISKGLRLDLIKYNSQHDPIEIIEFKDSHDRFLILDEEIIYHIGASLKDLGKKWFAFSRMEKGSLKILEKLKQVTKQPKQI